MTSDRKEPTLSSIVPERDEIASHQQRAGARARPRSNPNAAAPPPVRRARSPLAPFALLLALTGLGLAGFLYWQVQGLQQALGQADSRIQELESRLELSDDESSQSVTAIRAKLKWADSEIRKLWGVSHDRNRKAIAENKQQLQAVEKTVKGSVAETGKLLQQSTAVVTDLQAQSEVQRELMDGVVDDINAQRQQLQAMADLANRLDQQLGRLQTDMNRRVKSNEEAIEAIDAYRRNINRDLLQLKQQVQGGGASP